MIEATKTSELKLSTGRIFRTQTTAWILSTDPNDHSDLTEDERLECAIWAIKNWTEELKSHAKKS